MSSYNIKEILGSKMFLIKGDGGVSKQLIKHEIREVGATKETIKILKPGMICIDIGSNLGYYALLEAKLVGKDGFVYAIEPIEENVIALINSVALNGYKNIKVYKCAIGSSNSIQKMIVSHKSNLGTLVIRSKNIKHAKAIIKVKTITLNNFCKRLNIRKINFLRMDVEGYEVEIIKGMNKTIKLMPKGSILSIEIHPKAYGYPFKPIIEMLQTIKDYGFKVNKYVLIENIIELKSYKHLIKLFDNKYCPQIFFERV